MSSDSLLTEAFRKVLAQPVPPSAEEQAIEDLFIKPRSVTAKDIANIPNLQSKGDVCRLMNDMEDNIQLIEYRTRAEEKAEKLEYLRKANMAPRCRHVKTDGDTCGCPALRDAQYCRFHKRSERPLVPGIRSGIEQPALASGRDRSRGDRRNRSHSPA